MHQNAGFCIRNFKNFSEFVPGLMGGGDMCFMKRNEGAGVRRALEFEVECVTRTGRPRLGWREQADKE